MTGAISAEPDKKWAINAWCWVGLESAAEHTILFPPSYKYSVKSLAAIEMTGDFSGFQEREVGVTNITALQTSGWEKYDGIGGGPWPQTYADGADRNVKAGPSGGTSRVESNDYPVGIHVTGEKFHANVEVNFYVRGKQSILNDKNRFVVLTSKITGTFADDGQEGWDGWLTSFQESAPGEWEQISEHRIPSGDIVVP